MLPIRGLYLSERCNSRCITCDYWRHGVADMTVDLVRRLLPDLVRLHTQVALISGGKRLFNDLLRHTREARAPLVVGVY